MARIERDDRLHYKSGYKYQVTRDYHIKLVVKPYLPVNLPFIKLQSDGSLTIRRGYAWNGASGPTWDTKSSMIGSLVHDVLYQLIRLGLIDPVYKTYADQMLHDICVEDGMWEWRADYWRWAVLKFGEASCKPSAEPREEVAP